jgi:two-component system CheB/CheR fusion protein
VFDLFVQGDRSVSRVDSGLGVGLTMVQRLVWLHGGDVEARSAGPGRGSEFVVTLPIVPQPAAALDPADPSESAWEGGAARRILVVDDNSDAAETLADLLSLWGYETEAAFDGPTGIQIAQRQHPDAILLDISMPGMSGYDVARELRKIPELEGVLLVALTGYGQEEDRRKTYEAGFDLHLVKPVDPEKLQNLLETYSPVTAGVP